MALHKEIEFENDICNHLAANGWLYAEGDAKGYDTPRALFPADVMAWVQESQPDAWAAIVKAHGANAEATLLDRLRKLLDDQGTLHVLRVGLELMGPKGPVKLAQFKPALAMNPELQARYAANRLRVVRQVRTNHDDIIDLVLFLNGIPVATAELKSEFTQGMNEAVDQYKFDRIPKPKGKAFAEPLLEFPRGALVHFAVTNRTVMMTTRLQGPSTYFLPFNMGDHGAAGNPPNGKGHRTHYLWEQVWQRDSWLEIIARYLVTKKDDKKRPVGYLFPRYHQLDATRKLVQAVLTEGVGQKYLIQHSAGSGKTNSIAWTAHFLADLHDAANNKLFSTVLVVSDRTVLDTQLQEAIFDFERTAGVVATIKGESQSKSGELAEALSGGKKIVVCTIQTFPFALKAVQELAATQGKRFAVIADEAHSSQTGEAAGKLKQVLSAQELQDLADGGEVGTEDILAAQMSAKAGVAGTASAVTYVAFTATPKAKTLELFGRRPNPDLPAGPDNLPAPFHVYSMRQAIEEGFILDVLKNYTSYKLAFKLAHNGKEWDDKEVERSEALKGLMRWVRLHPYNIAQKVQVVVEHFLENVQPLLKGHAKAMVVVGSRVEAVRWKLAVDEYIKAQGYTLGTLVAYSGEVNDPKALPEPVTENSTQLNPGLKGRDIRDAFATDEFQILLVANKFQTGFDQPLLCGMYVDKKLAGIQAVQTLSRLNRAYNGAHGLKDTTYILDFANDPQEILAAFQTYYETAELAGVTDPNLIFDLRAKLDATGHYDDFEVERVVQVELNPKATQAQLVAAIEPVADRLLKRFKAASEAFKTASEKLPGGELGPDGQAAKDELEALTLFKRDLGTFVRVYAFLSQMFDYGNTAIEKRAIFFKRLMPLLDFGKEREGVDLSKVSLTHHKLKKQGGPALVLGETDGDYKLDPMTASGSGQIQDKEKIKLSEIVQKLNGLFDGELTDHDMLAFVDNIKGKMMESELLVQQAMNNTKEQFSNSPDFTSEQLNAIIDAFDAFSTMSKQALDSEKVRQGLKGLLLGPAELYEALRSKGARSAHVNRQSL
ncbi:type I restriction endonuclease subunit R [Aquabacterium lacunae]|uniref:Type I restriction endonuclease subunit R n=1 Tax=Aquabacterium lacunae TaxID=2528630 RepID=A0A4Q9H451_9BURK|nr:DEAD/DEAH box helicase family protein [Aquabacterium lacunae]TBO34441.1 type I restriction endonuclease subunit R [Aquabacterium lacunae]